MLKEKIMKIEEEKNNLLKEKQRCGHDFSALQISMEERELEYEEICKRNEVTRTEIKVVNDCNERFRSIVALLQREKEEMGDQCKSKTFRNDVLMCEKNL